MRGPLQEFGVGCRRHKEIDTGHGVVYVDEVGGGETGCDNHRSLRVNGDVRGVRVPLLIREEDREETSGHDGFAHRCCHIAYFQFPGEELHLGVFVESEQDLAHRLFLGDRHSFLGEGGGVDLVSLLL